MNTPIWPVVTENLAEQLAVAQGGRVHPVQLLPYLPLSIQQVEGVLDELCESDRVFKETDSPLTAYIFKEYLDAPPVPFNPQNGVYSNDPLDKREFTAITHEVQGQIQEELGQLAEADPWPGDAVWQHELLYLLTNLKSPVFLSALAGHSRMSFKKVERRVDELVELGAVEASSDPREYQLPPLAYPKPAYMRHDAFIRQFPGAIHEELESRLLRALLYVLIISLLCLLIAFTARFPFPLLLMGGGLVAGITFFKTLFAKPKPLPDPG